MKKRVLSLTLTLVMLLGLLPSAALAAETESAGALATVAMAPAPAEVLAAQPMAARAVILSPTLTLGAPKAYRGEDLTEIAPGQWASGAGSYAVTAGGLTLRAAETAKGTAAAYVLQPFTLSMNVPARTAYTVAFKVSGTVDRGSDGSSEWFSELESSAATDKTLNTQANGTMLDGAVARAYGNSRSYRFSPAGFAYITFDNTDGTDAKTVTRDCAWLLGAAKPKSVSANYLHQMDATLTLTVDQGESRAVKAITYDPNYDGGSEADNDLQVTADSPVTLFAAPTWAGHTFLGWKDAADGAVYPGGAAYTKDVGTTLTAQWEVKKSTVTFDYQGAIGGNTETVRTVTYGQPYGALPAPTRTGYDFIAWGTTSVGGYEITGDTPVYLTEDHTLYAIWDYHEFKIPFDANGGSPSYTATIRGEKLGPQPFGVDVTRPGYTLAGWYTAQTGGTKIDQNTAPHAAGARVYAHWTPNTYTVTLNAAGGSVSSGTVQAAYDSAYSLPTPTRAGYQFDGWYTDPSAGDKVTGGATKVTQTADHTLYAHWSKPTWTVTFNAGGGYPETTTRRVDRGAAVGELPTVARTGYTFTGWSPSVTAGTVPTGNAAYTAQWRANTYAVTYNPNGGEGGGAGTVTFDTAYSGGTPTRTGYTFQGWSTTPTGGAASKCSTAKDHTVYAVWKGISCTVTLDPNGGTLSGGNTKTVTPGRPYGSLPKPTGGPSGKSFMGWMVDGKVVGQNTVVTKTGNHTLTARWEGTHTHGVDGGTGSTTYKGLTSQNFENAKKKRTDPTTGMTYSSTVVNKGYTLPSGNYYLVGGITLDAPLTLSGGNLCFNGATITLQNRSYISQGNNVLNICDCSGGGGVTSNDYYCFLSAASKEEYIATLYGGTFTATGDYCVNQNSANNTLIIDGATIMNNNTAADTYALRTIGKTTVKSGTISGYIGASTRGGWSGQSAIIVEGGDITGTGSYGIENVYTATVSGGTVTGSNYGIYNESTGTLTVSGGAVTSTVDEGIYNGGALTVSGGTVTGAAGKYGIDNPSTATVTGGTVSGINNYATLAVRGGVLSGRAHGIILNGGTLTLGGSPILEGSSGGIYLADTKTVTVESGLTGAFSVATAATPTAAAPVPITTSGNYAANFTAADPAYGVRYRNDQVELYPTHKHLPCGKGEACTHSGNAHTAAVEFDPVTGGSLNTGSYYLTANGGAVTVPSNQTVNLCLSGKSPSSIDVQGTLNLCNCGSLTSGTVTVSGSGVLNQYSGVTVNVTPTGGVWNFYGGKPATANRTVTPGGRLYLLDAPNLNGGTISLGKGKVVHLGSGLKTTHAPYKLTYTGTLTPADPQVTLTDGWSALSGADLNSYFTYTGGGKAKLEVSGGEVVLRLPRITVNGQTYYLTSGGTLPALPPTPAKPGADQIWDGWYDAATGGTKVTTATVLHDGATLYPRWTACTHSNTDVTTVPATCTAAGSTKTVCKTCGHTTTATIEKLAHTYDGDPWHRDEVNHWHQCTVCGGERTGQAAHAWDGGIRTGFTMNYTCTAGCGATKAEAIPSYTVTFELDPYTAGDARVETPKAAGDSFQMFAGDISRAGYDFGGWQLLDDKGQPTGEPITGQFTMPARDVRFRVVWNQKASYTPQSGETVVLPDGTTIKNDGANVTIDQDGDGTPETTVDPNGSNVIIQTGDPSQKPTLTIPAGSTVQTGDGPTVTLPADGIGSVDPSGVVDAPVGSTVTDSEGNKVEITGENPGTIDPAGSVTFPEGTDGKVTVTPQGGEPQDVDVTGGSEGVDSSGETPLPDTPTVVLPEGGDTLALSQGQPPKQIEGVTAAPEGTVLTWTSSDENVVTVSNDGTVTVVGPGTATVTVTPAGGDPVTIAVTVTAHTHAWAEGWTTDEGHHWHVCTADYCDITDYSAVPESAYGAHTYDNGDDVDCNGGCGYTREAPEAYPAPGDNEGYAINYTDETVAVTEGYEISTKNDGTGEAVTDGSVTPGATLYIRKKADETHGTSEWAELTVPARPDAPEGVTAVDETVTGNGDGKLTGLTAGVAYEIAKDGGAWTDAAVTESGEITGLAPGSYQVRAKATLSAFAGEPATVTVAEGAAHTYTLKVTAPVFDVVTEGYDQPAAKAITIQDNGNSEAAITAVEVSDPDKFTVGGSGDTVPAGGSIDTWTIQPAAGLSAGVHTATITVTHDGETAQGSVTFTVRELQPTIEIDYAAGTLTGFAAGGTYTVDGAEVTPENGVLSVADYFGKTVSIVKKGSGEGADSEAQSITIPAQPGAPQGLTVTAESVDGKHDGKIAGVTEAMEYSADGGATWTPCGGTELTGLAPGAYQVRAKAVPETNTFAGEPATVTVAEGAAHTYTLAVTAPTFDEVYEGYEQPEAKAITIQDNGNSEAAITAVEVSGDAFTIGGSGDTVPAGGSIDTWTIQPRTGLDVGTHTATITVTHDGGETSEGSVTFTVNSLTHAWTWEITQEPTMDAPGEANHTCPGDEHHAQHAETGVEIPALSDTTVWTEDESKYVEPTEDAEGSKTYTSEYGEVTVALPKLDHTHAWGDWESNKLCHWRACSVCGEKKDYGAHVYSGDEDATCDECGYTRVLTQTAPAENEGYTINYTDETITVEDGYEVITAGGDAVAAGDALTPGVTLSIRKGADATHAASDWTPLPVPARPAAPAVQGVNETAAGAGDGKITGLTAGTAYQIAKDGGDWTDAAVTEDGEIVGLTPGAYQVRAAAAEDSFVGQAAGVSIATGDEQTYALNVAPPAFDAVFEGYDQPEAKAITIQNSGNSDAAITDVSVSDPDKFTVAGEGESVPAGGAIDTWTIQPSAGLDVGTHTATVTVTYTGGATATAEATFTVRALTHDWAWEITQKPTMDAPGEAAHSCPGDEHHAAHTETGVAVPALSDETVWTEDETQRVEPTETAPGSRTYTSEYGAVTVPIPATGHTPTHSISGTVTEGGVPVPGATVTLKQGSAAVATTATDSQGKYSFDGVAPGDYNVVAVADGKTMTGLTQVVDANATVQDLAIPADNVSSVLVVEENTPAVVVDGLDGEAQAVKADEPDAASVTVTMTVTGKSESTADHAADIKTAAQGRELEYLEIKVEKTVDATTQPITTTADLMTVIIPFDSTGKFNVAVYRYHGSGVDTLTAEKNRDGEYIQVGGSAVTLYVKNFSTYAIGYTQTADLPEPPAPSRPSRPSRPAATVRVPEKVDEVCPKDEACPAAAFTDLDLTAWYHDGVHFCVERELMKGTSGTTFEPATPTTRAMIATILWRLQGSPVVNYALQYDDVAEETWYTEAVRWATKEGIVTGYGNGSFGPDDPITREQLATMLWRYAKVTGRDVSVGEDTNILSYVDVSEAGEWAIPAIQWAAGSGVITGKSGGLLDPQGQATRAEAAAMIQRYIQPAGK